MADHRLFFFLLGTTRGGLTFPITEALQNFILISSQADTGGLRDKPGKSADAYHTLYNLSGLSGAQHRLRRPPEERERIAKLWKSSWSLPIIKPEEGNAVERFPDDVRKEIFVASISWLEDEPASRYIGGKVNRVVRCKHWIILLFRNEIEFHKLLLFFLLLVERYAPGFRFDYDGDKSFHESLLHPKYLKGRGSDELPPPPIFGVRL